MADFEDPLDIFDYDGDDVIEMCWFEEKEEIKLVNKSAGGNVILIERFSETGQIGLHNWNGTAADDWLTSNPTLPIFLSEFEFQNEKLLKRLTPD